MKITSFSIIHVLAFILNRIPEYLAQFITLDSATKIGSWYKSNGIYKFQVGAKIKLRKRNIFGYGVDPRGVIKGYTPEGNYLIEMTTEKDGNFFNWMLTGVTDPQSEKTTRLQTHFKWNIEYQFKII
jgi:hypothetical protein